MTPLLVGLLLAVQDRSEVKQTLANGATVYTRRIEDSRSFCLTLGSASFAATEPSETHGLRHLIEHLQALGSKRDVDRMLESQGMMLTAETTRDSVIFEVSGPKDKFDTALKAVQSLLDGLTVDADEIAAEAGTIRQELALRKWSTELVADAWTKAYGEGALDPFGDPDRLASVTVDTLNAARSEMFKPRRLCLVATGDINAEAAAKSLAEVLDPLAAGDPPSTEFLRPASRDAVLVGSAVGEAVGLTVGPLTERETLASIAAAFGLQSWVPDATPVYTPSQRNGVVVVAVRPGWSKVAATLAGRERQIASTGLAALRGWARTVLSTPSTLAKLMASSLSVRPGFDPKTLIEETSSVGLADVEAKVSAFAKAGSGS
ncbi:MAG: insulinase family protein [Armatimonadetes bacterium]|nr:insulinase family protein [Armatimonadota bacterium]